MTGRGIARRLMALRDEHYCTHTAIEAWHLYGSAKPLAVAAAPRVAALGSGEASAVPALLHDAHAVTIPQTLGETRRAGETDSAESPAVTGFPPGSLDEQEQAGKRRAHVDSRRFAGSPQGRRPRVCAGRIQGRGRR